MISLNLSRISQWPSTLQSLRNRSCNLLLLTEWLHHFNRESNWQTDDILQHILQCAWVIIKYYWIDWRAISGKRRPLFLQQWPNWSTVFSWSVLSDSFYFPHFKIKFARKKLRQILLQQMLSKGRKTITNVLEEKLIFIYWNFAKLGV